MNAQKLFEVLNRFANDARIYIILALIAADVLFAVAQAIKENRFELKKLGDFYKTMVAPFVIGYLTLYVLVGLGVGFENFFGAVAVNSAFGTLAAHLVGSVMGHAKAIGFGFSPEPEWNPEADEGV
jgi:hypothetical protein